jgi:chromosomal replication initiation ATPase DnaA
MELSYIINKVNESLGIDIKNKKRPREYAYGRFLFMRLAKDLNPHFTLSSIGKSIKKDHSTVLYGLQMFENILEFKQEPELINLYLELLTELKQEKTFIESGFVRTEIILKNLKPIQKYYEKPIS